MNNQIESDISELRKSDRFFHVIGSTSCFFRSIMSIRFDNARTHKARRMTANDRYINEDYEREHFERL